MLVHAATLPLSRATGLHRLGTSRLASTPPAPTLVHRRQVRRTYKGGNAVKSKYPTLAWTTAKYWRDHPDIVVERSLPTHTYTHTHAFMKTVGERLRTVQHVFFM